MERLWKSDAVRWVAPLAWMGLIFYLSAQSSLPDLTPGAPSLQEIAGHMFVYFVLAFLWRWALAGAGVRHASWWALLIVALYGISDEFHQSFVPNRTPSFSDWTNDLLGGGIALGAVWWMGRRRGGIGE